MARKLLRSMGFAFVVMLAVAVGILPFWQVGLSAEPADASEYTVKRGDSLRAIAKDKGVVLDELAEANSLAPNAPLYRQQTLTIPEVEPAMRPSMAAAPRITTADVPEGATTYKVKGGDSLRSIAKKLGVAVAALAEANGLQPTSTLYKQQILIVPESATMGTADGAATPEPTEEPTAEPTEEGADEEPAADATPEPAAEELDIIDMAMAAGSFSFLTAALDAAELTDALRGEGPFTVFAPVDGAFAALPAADLQALLNDPSGDLTQILLYHVVPGIILAGEISDGATAVTLQGAELTFTVDGDSVMVNGANVITADIFASNGVIHVIDAVLIPPSTEAEAEATAEPTEEATAEPTAEVTAEPTAEVTAVPTAEVTAEPTAEVTAVPTAEVTAEPTAEATAVLTAEVTAEVTAEATAVPTAEATAEATAEPTAEAVGEGDSAELVDIVDTAIAAGDFTTLVAAIEAAGLVDALKGEGPYTVFAPTDAAFAALPAGALNVLLADPAGQLTQILLYHVVPDTALAADLADGLTLPTLQGGELTVNIGPDGATVNGVNIVVTDIETSNGVIHVIDAVLIPVEDQASGPSGPLAPVDEAASQDAASLIILPAPYTDAAATAALWPLPSGNLAVFSPVETGAYHSPIAVTGLARGAEGFVAIDLVDSTGQVLAHRATQGGTINYAFFHTNLRFTVFEVTEATLTIVEMDMADGSILTELSVPVTLIPGQRVIDVTAPVVGQLACEQVLVSGYSSTFEANVVLTLQAPLGAQLEQMPVMGGTMGIYRDFVATFEYTSAETVPLLVSLEETDASGRFPSIDKTVVPFILYPAYSSVCY